MFTAFNSNMTSSTQSDPLNEGGSHNQTTTQKVKRQESTFVDESKSNVKDYTIDHFRNDLLQIKERSKDEVKIEDINDQLNSSRRNS